MAMRAVQSIHICFSIVVMSCGVFQVPFSLKCCLCRSDLLNLSIMLFLGKAGVHYSFFFILGKETWLILLFLVYICREYLCCITQGELQPNSSSMAELVLSLVL